MRLLEWMLSRLGADGGQYGHLADLLMTLIRWEGGLAPEARTLWRQSIADLGPEGDTDTGEPAAKKRHTLYTEAGDGTGGHVATAGRGAGADASAAGTAEAEASGGGAGRPPSQVLSILRLRSKQLTHRYMSSATGAQTAERLLAMLQTHSVVLRLHALNFEAVDASLELRVHAQLWESAVRRLGSDAEAAPRYYMLLVDIATSLFALPACAQFIIPTKAFLASVASLPWICGDDSYGAASSDAQQPLNSVTHVDSLRAIWSSHVLPHLTAEDLSSCVHLMALIPTHSNSTVPHHMLLNLCKKGHATLQAAAIAALPYFLATCRRYNRNSKVDFGEFRGPLEPVLGSPAESDEVSVVVAPLPPLNLHFFFSLSLCLSLSLSLPPLSPSIGPLATRSKEQKGTPKKKKVQPRSLHMPLLTSLPPSSPLADAPP